MSDQREAVAAALAHAAVSAGADPLLATRGRVPSHLKIGQAVQISYRCGDGWGEDNRGVIQSIAAEPDAKGRYFVAVLMDGKPDMNGKRRPDGSKNPPLPKFEAGLVTPVKE